MSPHSVAVTQSKTNDIFEWNKKKLLGHLLAMEEHLNELDDSDVPNSWCLKKHWTEAVYHHLSEAITNVERLGLDLKPYLAFRKRIMALHIYPSPHVTEKEVMELRTEWRRIIEDPTLESTCPLCAKDVPPEVLAELEAEAPSQPHVPATGNIGLGKKLLKLEADYTSRVLKTISKYRREPPSPFMIVDCGNIDPSGKALATTNEDGEPFMAVCAGGVNAHALLHEVDHIERHRDGECKMGGCSESKAEDVAIQTMWRRLSISQPLNTHSHGGGSGKPMVEKATIMKVYGTSLVASAAKKWVLPLVDTSFPNLIAGQKASWWTKVVLGVAPLALYFVFKKKIGGDAIQLPILVFSSTMLADVVVDYAATLVPAGVAPVSIMPRSYAPAFAPSINGGGAVIV